MLAALARFVPIDSGGLNFFDPSNVLERCLTTVIIDHFFRLIAADYANFVSMVYQVQLLRMLKLAAGYHIVFS